MNVKLEELKKRQTELEKFFEGIKDKAVSGSQLRKWIIDSALHFTDVGVSSNIIDHFIERCEFQTDSAGRESHGIFSFRITKRGYTLNDQGRTEDGSPFIIPALLALRVSKMLISKHEEEERVIPTLLIKLFDNEKHQTIKLALESIESNYQTHDAKGMLSPLITSLELICKNIKEIEKEKNIGSQLKKLYEQPGLQKKYNVNKDVVWALNNSRIIRNEEVIHAKAEHMGNIPMYETVGYAHLLVLFLDSILVSGEIAL